MSAARHSLQRLTGGGVSLGYSGFKTYGECNESFWWAYLQGGTGIEPVGDGFQFERCYGSAWHELWRHCAVEGTGTPLDPPFNEWCRTEGFNPSDSHVHALYRTLLDDFEWYYDQPEHIRVQTVLAEEELKVRIKSPRSGLEHELRGTPDEVAEISGSWGGGYYIVDAKTYSAVKNDGKLYVDPPDTKIKKDGRKNAQFPSYMGLWNLTHPEKPVFDGLAHFVPQRAAEAQRLLLGRKGNQKTLKVHNVPCFINPDEIQRQLDAWVQACDDIALRLDAVDPHGEFERRRNRDKCVNDWGRECAFISLCECEGHLRADYLRGAWQQRKLVGKQQQQVKEAA